MPLRSTRSQVPPFAPFTVTASGRIRSAGLSRAKAGSIARPIAAQASHREITATVGRVGRARVTAHLVANRDVERLRGSVVEGNGELRRAACERSAARLEVEVALHARKDVAAGVARRELGAGGRDERELARLHVSAAGVLATCAPRVDSRALDAARELAFGVGRR